ncbi:MAG: DUF21 domain-containing protein [Erythrobacter sp.]
MNDLGVQALTWLGILFCLSQSAMFSGLNLAYFSVSRLKLEVEAGTGNTSAKRILKMREDSNFLLTTILWSNVGINVLLTLLSSSVMAGITAFAFSTFAITIFGEIFPQAYFSRNALKVGARLAPVLGVYQIILYPVAKPVAMILDAWLGKEGIEYFRERGIREIIRKHMDAEEADLGFIEGLGALNFFSVSDVMASHEGEPINPESVVALDFKGKQPLFPTDAVDRDSQVFKDIQRSGKKWAIITDKTGEPRLAIDTDGYLRAALLKPETFNPQEHCHRPIIIRDADVRLGDVLQKFEVLPEYKGDNVIDRDVVLLWTNQKRVITGADILGRLLEGISRVEKSSR